MSLYCQPCNRSISCPWCDGTIDKLTQLESRENLLGELLAACKTASVCLRLLPPVFHVAQAQGELVKMCERALREIQTAIAKATGTEPA